MKRLPGPLQWLLAVAAAGCATGICAWLDGAMSVAGLAMVYLVAVVGTAVLLDRAAGLLASLLCVSALNFFFVPPRYTFEVSGAEYWWTLAVLLGLSLGLHALIVALRQRRDRAERGEAHARQLHALSEALAGQRGEEAMAAAAAGWMHATLAAPCAIFLGEADTGVLRCFPAGADADAFDTAPTRWAMDHGRAVGRGCDDWPDLPLWCAPFLPAPSAGAVHVLVPTASALAADEAQHWVTLARQVALSVERERAGRTAQAALERAQAEAARNTLLASLSHDLRTPLAAILGSASALRAQADSLTASEREQLLAAMESEARELTLMADNILQWARLSQPHAQIALQWESLEEILGTALVRARRQWPQLEIALRVAPDLPPIRAEASLLAQLVANLVDNAQRHGGLRPRVTIEAGTMVRGVYVSVRDQGTGLPAGDPKLLFERYSRRGRDGTAGLGLAMCQLIAQAHGGRIEARRCEPGAEFRLELPGTTQEVAHG
jgi:two-component system sensor histidine kinase KdpD